jgi:hypothetical protein
LLILHIFAYFKTIFVCYVLFAVRFSLELFFPGMSSSMDSTAMEWFTKSIAHGEQASNSILSRKHRTDVEAIVKGISFVTGKCWNTEIAAQEA